MRFLYFTLFIFITGCSAIYGVKSVKKNDIQKINSFLTENNYWGYHNYYLDEKYARYIKSTFSNDGVLMKYFLQPLQAFYFIEKDSVSSYFVNCNAGGFPNLDWNKNGAFNAFPPIGQTKINRYFTLADIDPFLHQIPSEEISKNTLGIIKTRIIVFYSLIIQRQCKRFIDLIISNSKLSKSTVEIYTINMDNLFAG